MATEKENAANEAELDTDKEIATEQMGEEKKLSRIEKLSPLLMTLIVAIPAAAIVAYINMPQKIGGSQGEGSNAGVTYQTQASSPSAANWSRSQQPEWVAEHRAKMEKRRAEFEKKNEAKRTQTEAPQWVKDQQAKMQQEQARYQEQMKKQFADMRNNRMPGSMNQQAMNMPQPWQNQPVANPYPQQVPAPYYNGYPQPQVSPYYSNGPYYQPGPYNGPYGYPYR